MDNEQNQQKTNNLQAILINPLDIPGFKLGCVHVDDFDMAYGTIGEGDPIVLIMGYGSTMDMWPPGLLYNLSGNHKVIIFDSRGMGNSSSSDKEFTIGLFADDVAGLMKGINVNRASILGWSMGASVAQEFAVRHPGMTESLILISGNCGGDQSIPPSPAVIGSLTDMSGPDEERGMRLLRLMFPPAWMAQHPDPRTYFPIPRETSPPESTGRQAEAIGSWNGTYEKLPSIRGPVLLITGTDDLIAPPKNSLIIAGQVPGAWLIRISGTGHGMIYQETGRVSNVIEAFLKNAS